MSTQWTRRRFIAASAALAAAPVFVPSRLLGAEGPSNKIVMGCIGVGWQGMGNMNHFLNHDDVRVVAIADVDANHRQKAVGRVNQKYKNKDCAGYNDFRELLARKDLDAVCISTPDHWHAIPAIAAAKAGLHIFCEKPLSHSFNEGVAMVDAVEKAGVVWQTGSWQRSTVKMRLGVQLVINGYIGKVRRVEVGLPSGHTDFHKTGKDSPNSAPPAELDYEMWVGPSRMMPYNRCVSHKNWRWNYNYGGGQLLDWVGHHNDIAHWALASKEFGCGISDRALGPLTVSAIADFPSPDALWNTATKFRVESQYPANVEVVISGGHRDIAGGTKWIGEHGWVHVNRGHINASDKKWIRDVDRKARSGELKHILPAPKSHWIQLIEHIKKNDPNTLTPIAVAHRSQTPGHLGTIAARLKRTLKWDADKQQIIGDAEANKMLGKTLREPWTL